MTEDNIPDYLKVNCPKIERQRTHLEIIQDMRQRLDVLDSDNSRLCRAILESEKREIEMTEQINRLKVEIEELKSLQVEKENEAKKEIENGVKNKVENKVKNEVEKIEKKNLTISDFGERKARLRKISGTLERVLKRTSKLIEPKQIEQINHL